MSKLMKTVQRSGNEVPSKIADCGKFMKRLSKFCFITMGVWSAYVSSVQGQDAIVNNLTVNVSATGVLPTTGKRYVIVEQMNTDTPQQRGTKLLAAYAKARDTMGPSANNRLTVLIPPGDYDLGTAGITLDTPYIDLIGMVPARMTKRVACNILEFGDYGNPIMQSEIAIALPRPACGLRLYGTGNVIRQTADNVRIANMVLDHRYPGEHTPGSGDWDTAAYWPENSFPFTLIEHVKFETYGFQNESVSTRAEGAFNYSGTYRDCVAGDYSFTCIGNANVVSGTFEDCVGGDASFGGGGLAGATLRYCSAGDGSFGGTGDISGGLLKNCLAGAYSFGGSGTYNTGTFEHCIGGTECFNGGGDAELAAFRYCFARAGSFNVWGGYFDHCKAGANSFHWSADSNSSTTLTHCKAGAGSFGTYNIASADFSKPMGDLSMGSFTQ